MAITRPPLTREQREKLVSRLDRLTPDQRLTLTRYFMPRMCTDYMAHIPHPKQQMFLTLNTREAMYGGAAGGGKALSLDTPLVTPDGWVTMGDVKVGDYLVDEKGKPTQVLAKSEVFTDHTVYEVTFSDGAKIVADEGHLWAVRNTNRNKPQVKTTGELIKNLTTPLGRHKWAIPVSAPIEGKHLDLIIDPYVLGVWLGDGDTRRGYVTVGAKDSQILDMMREAGETLSPTTSPLHWRVDNLSERLRTVGILGTYRSPNPKRIPKEYLRASVSQRLALLQGIVDTDGYVDGDVEITFTNPTLIDGLLELLHSLGIKARATESRATIDGKDHGPKWRVKFMTELPVARLERKANKQKRNNFRGTHNLRYITSIIKVETVPVQCVKVSGESSLYLAGKDMVPTHNSDAILMAALQYVDVPGYSALILRKSYPDLIAPGAILDRANTWWSNKNVRKREGGRIWEFPTVDAQGKPAQPARISFGTLLFEKDKYRYQSAEYQFVGFDELTHFDESQYLYLFSRIRRPQVSCLNCSTALELQDDLWEHANKGTKCATVKPDQKVLDQYPVTKDGMSIFNTPLRMRSATNPGGRGHAWVRDRFISPETRDQEAVFIPALLQDNPSLDQASYMRNLQHLSPVDRERLLNGDWDVVEQGEQFERAWFKPIQPTVFSGRKVRYWDHAASKGKGDWTVGALVTLTGEGKWVIEDIVRGQWSSHEKERIIKQTAIHDGISVPIRMEQEPGSSGVDVIDNYRRRILVGFNFDGIRASGDKVSRSSAFASAAEAGNVYMVNAQWNKAFLDEATIFPLGKHDDQIDAVSHAVNYLAFTLQGRLLV